ncbi:MAG TPA: hypothetical protein VIJ31_09820 [Acidothermaceae bacterium]
MNFPDGIQMTLISRTANGTDAYGNDAFASTTSTFTSPFVPAGSTEQVQGRDTVIENDTIYPPAGTVINPTDQVQIDDDVYEVIADALDWVNPFTGWAPAIEVHLQKVSG